MVRGAVICGVEKELYGNLMKMTACPQNYGVCIWELFSETKHHAKTLSNIPHARVAVSAGQMKWLVKKGDVLLSNSPHVISQRFNIAVTEATRGSGSLPIYSYPKYDPLPDRFETAKDGSYS